MRRKPSCPCCQSHPKEIGARPGGGTESALILSCSRGGRGSRARDAELASGSRGASPRSALSGPDHALHVTSSEQPLPASPSSGPTLLPGPGAPKVTQTLGIFRLGRRGRSVKTCKGAFLVSVSYHYAEIFFKLVNINRPPVTCKT